MSDPENEAAEADDKTKQKRLSPAEWAEIVEHYELGTKSAQQLAAEYGVSRQTLSERFKKHNVSKGSKAHTLGQAVQATVTQAVQAQTQATVERFADKRLQRIEDTKEGIFRSSETVKKMIDKTVLDAMKNGLAYAAIDDDIKALRRLGLAYGENARLRLELLGADHTIDETMLPTITIDDLTKQMILDHHKYVTGAAPEDATIDDLEKIVGDVEID